MAGLALALLAVAPSLAQGPAAKKAAAAPAGPDTSPIGRYAPAEGLVLYLDCEGLEAKGDAWKGTATYKILNETPTGAMLEEILTQLIDRAIRSAPAATPAAANLPPGASRVPS